MGVSFESDADLPCIRSDALLRIASTAQYGGGLTYGRCIVSARVPHSYSGLDPAQDIQEIAAARGLHPDVSLMRPGLRPSSYAVESPSGIASHSGFPVTSGSRPRNRARWKPC